MTKRSHAISLPIGLIMISIATAPHCRSASAQAPSTRLFHLGFTQWPADLTMEGVNTSVDFSYAHGDIVSVMFIGGIPWPEALAGQPFSANVKSKLGYRSPRGKKLFLSISPLDQDRKGLAPYWGDKDNLPLPRQWTELPLNSAEVKKAFLQFTLRAVGELRPDYLAIGIESNILLSHHPDRWQQLKELHGETYAAVKKKHPELPVCFTTDVLHYKRLTTESRGSDQAREVADLMQYSDLFAMSIYPHMSYDVPTPVPATFFDFARSFQKPIAVSESGLTSRNVELKAFGLTLRGSPAAQRGFTERLTNTAACR